MSSEQQQPSTSPSRKSFFGLGKKDGSKTPTQEVSQTPILEHGNAMEKHHLPTEARNQQIVGVDGGNVSEGQSKILLALDGTEAGDKAFNYLLTTKVVSRDAHVFIATVLPAHILSGPWVAGPLSIDTKKQNEMLKQLRTQALAKLQPYRDQLRDAGFQSTVHVLHGDARQSLVRVAQYHKVDLVLAGKRTKKGLTGLTSGTTSSHLIHHSPVPVLVIR